MACDECSPSQETHITSDMWYSDSGRLTHNASDMRSPTQLFPFIRNCLKFVKEILVSKGERFFRIAAFDCITLSHISNEHSVLSFE